jgi:hypothetical protein
MRATKDWRPILEELRQEMMGDSIPQADRINQLKLILEEQDNQIVKLATALIRRSELRLNQ